MLVERTFDTAAAQPVAHTLRVKVVRTLAAAVPFLAAWEALAAAALEPNVFYSPWLLMPALQYLLQGQGFALVFVFGGPVEGAAGPALVGFFPLLEPVLPFAPMRLLHHDYCFSTAPLLRAGREREALDTFFDWMQERRMRHPLLRMEGAPGDGPVAAAMRDCMKERGLRVFESAHFQRPLFRTGEDPESYLQRILPGKRRSEYRRQGKRLAELGEFRTRVLQAGDDDLEAWLAAFVELEQRGWKGASNSALGSQERTRRFFAESARAAHARGQLSMFELSLDGRPLAMLCDFLAAPGAYAFKMGFDEAYAKYSPGVLMELEFIPLRHQLKARGVHWIDSCAAPDNQVTSRLWEDRRTLCSYMVSSGGPLGDLLVRLYPFAKRMKRRVLQMKARLAGDR
ncbi:Acetyltransferase (GNAT) domain protein [compost metagenome]